MNTINMLGAVADNLEIELLDTSVVNFASAVTSLDTVSFNDPVVLDLIYQISSLFLELSKLTY